MNPTLAHNDPNLARKFKKLARTPNFIEQNVVRKYNQKPMLTKAAANKSSYSQKQLLTKVATNNGLYRQKQLLTKTVTNKSNH